VIKVKISSTEMGHAFGNGIMGFGIAEDCNCHDDCHLATFNVNLTGTGFYLHPQV